MVPIFKDFLCSFDCRTALIQSRRPWGYERSYSQSQTLGSTGFKRGIAKLLSLYETIQNNPKHRELSTCFSRAHRWTGSVQALYVQAFCEYGCCLPVRGEHGVAWISNLALNGRSQFDILIYIYILILFCFQRLAASRLLQRLEDWIPLHDLPKLSVLKTEDSPVMSEVLCHQLLQPRSYKFYPHFHAQRTHYCLITIHHRPIK